MSEKFTRRELEAMERYDSSDNDYSLSSSKKKQKYKCKRCRDTGYYDSRGCDCDDRNIVKCNCKEMEGGV